MVELSSLDVLFLARELQSLENAYVDRIYEVGAGEFLFRTRHPDKGRGALLVRPSQFACLIQEPPETPQSPTNFAMVLRKHLTGVRIRRIEQQEFDRVLVFHVEERGEPLRLIVELFGKGNLLVVGPDDKIRVVQRPETFRDRTLRVGETFKFPPTRVNPALLSRADFDRLGEETARDAVRFLATDLGFGGDLAEELLFRGKVGKNRKTAELLETERESIWNAWQAILHAPPRPALAAKGADVRIQSIPFGSPKFEGWSPTPVPTLSEAIDRARQVVVDAAPPPPDEERERLERQIESQAASIATVEKEAEEWSQLAARLYEDFPNAKAAHEAAAELAREGDWSKAEKIAKDGKAAPMIVRVLPEARRVVVRVGEHEFTLDPLVSLERNASMFFDESKRLRAKVEGAEVSIAEARKKLLVRERLAAAPKPAAKVKAPDKRFWFEAYRWFYTTDGFLVVGGRDASTNEKVVKKHLSAQDLYFHADVHGAPSCVLKTDGRPATPDAIRQAAQFAASYSKAFSQFGSADAYYVRPEQVSKTAESGEYVPRGAFMVRGERTYVPRLPMEIGLGLVRLGKEGKIEPQGLHRRLVGGPVEAIEKIGEKPLRVVRGDRKPPEVVREVAQHFGTSHEEAQAVLPAGTLKIMGRERGAP